jgi:parvulin-like peptidyl-prolyl isomerase
MPHQPKKVALPKAQIVAKVGKHVISNLDVLMRAIMVATFSGQPSEPDSPFVANVYEQVLQKLIDERIYELLAESSSWGMDKRNISSSIQNYAERCGLKEEQFVALLKQKNLYDTFVQMIRAQIFSSILNMSSCQKDLVRITEKQVEEQIKKMQKRDQTTQYLILEIVFYAKSGTSSDAEVQRAAANTYAELERQAHGDSNDVENPQSLLSTKFQDLATQLSQSPTAKNAGVRGWVSEDDLDKASMSAIAALKVGQYTRPLKVRSGEYSIYFLADIKRPGLLPDSETRVELAAVIIPYNPSMSQQEQLHIQQCYDKLVECKSESEFKAVALTFGYKTLPIVNTLNQLPQDFALNKCMPLVFTGEVLVARMPTKIVLNKSEFHTNKEEVKAELEHSARAVYAERIFKNFKSRTMVQILPDKTK